MTKKPSVCVECGSGYEKVRNAQKFCSTSCKGKHKYSTGEVTTNSQYEKINGNWRKYLQRLLYVNGNKRESLSVEDLLEIIEEQNYRCALSGVELTGKLEVGKVSKTNASVDRIDAGGPYIKENIQLVCRAVNGFRTNTSVEEYIWWCKKVAEYHE